MDLAVVHCHVDGDFLLTNNIDLDQRGAGFSRDVRTSAKNGCFLECKFETSQNGGVRAIRPDRGMHRDAITGPVTVLGSVDGENYGILGEMA